MPLKTQTPLAPVAAPSHGSLSTCATPPAHALPDTGAVLLAEGAIALQPLKRARAQAARQDATLEEILIHDHALPRDRVETAQARAWGAARLTGLASRLDRRLFTALHARDWLDLGCLPVRDAGAAYLIATWMPEKFEQARPRLELALGRPVSMALARREDLETAILDTAREDLADRAETMVHEDQSCRTMRPADSTRLASVGVLGAALVFIGAPVAVFAVLFVIAGLVVLVNTMIKLWMTLLSLFPERPEPVDDRVVPIGRLPVVTLFVPLFRERDIAPRLIARLGRLDYPRALLDIIIIAEERDSATLTALDGAKLPSHMRVVVVPHRTLRTKPRAMNYALNTARGQIVGIYDAEDAPEPDQIRKVVDRFQRAGPRVACLQGALDYYNARTNWMSRCFTAEYAGWFRVMLPGFARVGFPVPLGGTTVFIRRDVLEELGGWDAHNVTEDADLGMRLARAGYRTELVDTVTREEANCRLVPWVKQRSRWLKGYALTYIVHMRRPVALWRDLGPLGFFGLQALFLGTLLGFLVAPLLLSFWLVSLGLPHPVTQALGATAVKTLWIGFVVSEMITIALGATALIRAGHRSILPWVPSLHLYFPLATIALIKALIEMVFAPFYWDKTSHGHFDQDGQADEARHAAE